MRHRNATLIDLAPLSMGLIAGCLAYYGYLAMLTQQAGLGSGLGGIDYGILQEYGASLREGVWEGQWHRFVLPVFMHASLFHLLFNLHALYSFGPGLEMHFGTSNFGSIYLLSGLGGVCLSLLFTGGLSVGASGAIFGMLGATLAIKIVQCPDLRRATRNSEVRKTAGYCLAMFLVCFLWPWVDHWAHLGGLLLGLLYGWLFEHWRKHQRIGLALLAGMLLLTASGVAAARWMVFSPHYHVHEGIRALESDPPQVGRAREAFARAREWNRHWHSANAAWALVEAIGHANSTRNPVVLEVYAENLELLPRGFGDPFSEDPSEAAPSRDDESGPADAQSGNGA